MLTGSIWILHSSFFTLHFVIPVFSHPWLVFSPISSLSLTSLSSHLTQVIPDYSLSHHSCYHSSHTQCSHTHPHSLHSPSHLIVIPGYSLPSLVLPCSLIPAFSLTSLLWVLTPITCLLTLTISHRVSPHALSHPSHLCHHTEWSHITCVLRECLFPLPWCRTTTKSTLTLSSLSHTLPSMSSLWTLPWCRTTTKSSHTHTNPCAPTHSHVLTHSAPLTSFHLILTTNSSQLISHTLPPIMPPSHHHHLITSSYHLSPPIASSHSIQFIPPLSITPNPPNRLLNPLQSQFIPITTIVAPHRLPNNIKPIQSRRWVVDRCCDVECFCHFNFLSCVNKWANTDDITSYYSTFWTLKKPAKLVLNITSFGSAFYQLWHHVHSHSLIFSRHPLKDV